MKNPFARLLHHYTYNLKLKNKLVISHAILLMVPTAVVTGFLYARMYGIVMDLSLIHISRPPDSRPR